MLLIALFVANTVSITDTEYKFCNERTGNFEKYIKVDQNYLFIIDTYNTGNPVVYNTNIKYRDQLDVYEGRMTCRAVTCTKETLSGKSWGCSDPSGVIHKCYEFEHHIPKSNTIDELIEYTSFINMTGNFAMICNKWHDSLININTRFGANLAYFGDICDRAYTGIYTKKSYKKCTKK